MNPRDVPFEIEPTPAIEKRAAGWFGASDGGMTPEEEAALAAWLDADPRHAVAFRRLQAASRVLDQLGVLRPVGTTTEDPDLPLGPHVRRLSRHFNRNSLMLAAAASLAVACVLFWKISSQTLIFSAGAATEVGGFERITLPDGSVIDLNTDTSVRISFAADKRQVRLDRGEARFSVANDSRRPFVVYAGAVGVRAVGTAFNIRLRSDTVDVLVTEGRVRVDDSRPGAGRIPAHAEMSDSPLLVEGHRAVIPTQPREGTSYSGGLEVSTVNPAAIARAMAWRERRLEFEPQPLREVVAEFNRYNQHQLVIADDETAALRVGGTFEPAGYGALVRLLEASFGVVAETDESRTVLRQRH